MLLVIVMTEDECGRWVSRLLAEHRVHDFYTSPEWRRLRLEVLAAARYECADCRKAGRYSRAVTVHHNRHVKSYPRYALSRTYRFRGVEYQNLIPLCAACHERRHPERNHGKHHTSGREVTPERW